jgi:hypothetical protein
MIPIEMRIYLKLEFDIRGIFSFLDSLFPNEQTNRETPVSAISVSPTRKPEYAFWIPIILSEKALTRKMNMIAIKERIIEKNRLRIEFLKSITLSLIIA